MEDQNFDFGFSVAQEGSDQSNVNSGPNSSNSKTSLFSSVKWIMMGIACVVIVAFVAYRMLGPERSSDDAVVQLARTINESTQQMKALENRVDEQENAVQTQQTNQANAANKLQNLENDLVKLDRLVVSRLDSISGTLDTLTNQHSAREKPGDTIDKESKQPSSESA